MKTIRDINENNTILAEDYRAMLRDNVSLNIDLQNHIKIQDELLDTRENVIKTQSQEINHLEQELREADNFEDNLITQLRVSNYCASNQGDICDDIIEAGRQLDKLSTHTTLKQPNHKHSSSLMLKAVIQVALNALEEVDTETINQNL